MKIRRKVLNMSWEMWNRLDEQYGTQDSFETTPDEFLQKVGLPSALSAYLNQTEQEFFDQIYGQAQEGK